MPATTRRRRGGLHAHPAVDDRRLVAAFGRRAAACRRPDLVEDVEWLIASGESLAGAVRRLGYASPNSLRTVLARVQRPDLYRALAGAPSKELVMPRTASEDSSALGNLSESIGPVEQTSPEERRSAALTVVELAHDHDDARLLLDALGLS